MHSAPKKRRAVSHWLHPAQRRKHAHDTNQQAQAALDAQKVRDVAPEAAAQRRLLDNGLTLADLQPGECGTIVRLIGSTQGRLRLLEMGLTPGTHVKALRAAAFGGPLDILVRGYQLSLRREEAVGVRLGDADDVP